MDAVDRARKLRALQAESTHAESIDHRTLQSYQTLLRYSATTTRLGSHALDVGLADFAVLRRLGKRQTPVGGSKYYGVNSAVYMMQRSVLGLDITVAVKALYNFTSMTAPHELANLFGGEHAIPSNPKHFHPNLLRTYGYFVDEASTATLGSEWDADPTFVKPNTMFVVMEPMTLSLKQLFRRQPQIPADESLYILQRLMRAVVHLQRCGIVHRDIKPDNILLGGATVGSAAGGRSTLPLLVKLADFGEALDCVDAELDEFKMPFTKPEPSRGGAPAYLAPEVMSAVPGTHSNPTYIDYTKNDVFAAGMVAHFMLCNGGTKDPYERKQPLDPLHPYAAQNYNDLPATVAMPVQDLVRRMLQPNPARRISAEAALASIDQLLTPSFQASL